jgi:hypothetical protein
MAYIHFTDFVVEAIYTDGYASLGALESFLSNRAFCTTTLEKQYSKMVPDFSINPYVTQHEPHRHRGDHTEGWIGQKGTEPDASSLSLLIHHTIT